MRQYIILIIVSFVILVGLWDRTQSLELFLMALTMLVVGVVATHFRTQRAIYK